MMWTHYKVVFILILNSSVVLTVIFGTRNDLVTEYSQWNTLRATFSVKSEGLDFDVMFRNKMTEHKSLVLHFLNKM